MGLITVYHRQQTLFTGVQYFIIKKTLIKSITERSCHIDGRTVKCRLPSVPLLHEPPDIATALGDVFDD